MKNNIKKNLFTVLLLLCIFQSICLAAYTNVKILKVCDGDTIKVMINGKEECVRLQCIDCYETSKINRAYKQAYLNKISIEEVVRRGKCSKMILRNFLHTHPDISVRITGKDVYGRLLGVVYADGINVNEYMITNGGCMRYHYKK